MKIKFKNLEHKNIKIEDPIEYFGIDNYYKICSYYKLAPQQCAINAQKLAAYCIVNNKTFEVVECILESYHDGKPIYHPHCISYWNGHYFDFTLSIAEAYNIASNIIGYDTCVIQPNEKCIPLRRYEWNEIKKFIDYCTKNNLHIFLTFMDNLWHIDKNGKIQQPKENNNWECVKRDGIDNVYIIERNKFTIN